MAEILAVLLIGIAVGYSFALKTGKKARDLDARLKEMTQRYYHEFQKNNELQQQLEKLQDNPPSKPIKPDLGFPAPSFSPKPRPRPPQPPRDDIAQPDIDIRKRKGYRPEPLVGIDLFGWIEALDAFRSVFKQRREQTPSTICPLCKGEKKGRDFVLTNGWTFHEECVNKYVAAYDHLRTPEEARAAFQSAPYQVMGAKWICCYWPGYPPDWKSRKRAVLEKANFCCEECGESEEELHVHHIKVLGQGGSNALSNLRCLCRTCHESIHASLTKPKSRVSRWQKRQKALAFAIKNKEDVEFDYYSQKREKTHRKITPESFETRHGYLHVRGYCHLRKENRSFNLRRISNLNAKNEEGVVEILYQMER